MSYRQAFHTSCRSGLSGHAGFQYNAASPGLDDEQLVRLAVAHVGYRAAPDAPFEPSAAEIERMPVSLRYLPVEGVGPVLSRTAYVGREFRGADGEPDSGRFGNYFSHILVAEGAGFEGLLPIELWGAPHWTLRESSSTELPVLPRVDPGPVDLESVLAELLTERPQALAAVLDACLGAVLGGPRAVVVEPGPELAAAWVAWASFALPPDRAAELTFSTFDGRPRVAESVRLCVTTPACDVDFPAYELGAQVALVETTAAAGAGLSLYARVAAALAATGSEAVAAAVRELPAGLGAAELGAELAVRGGRVELAAPGEVAAVVLALRRRCESVPLAAAGPLAAAIPADDSEESLREWGALYALARGGEGPEAADLTDESLRRLLGSLELAGAIAEQVASETPTQPSVGVLATWLEQVSEAVGSGRLGGIVSAGIRLGLIGCNTALDRELANAIAADFDDPEVRRAYDAAAAAGNDFLNQTVTLKLAAAVGEGGSLPALRHVAADPVAREAVRDRAEREGSFEAVAAWQLLRVDREPAQRASAVVELAALATTERQAGLIRGLYGDRGPEDIEGHAELLDGWRRAGRAALPEDYQRALECLGAVPLRADPEPAALFRAIETGPKSVRRQPEFAAWWLLFRRPPQGRAFPDWAGVVAGAWSLLADLPPARREEIEDLVAEVAAAALEEEGYLDGLETLLGVMDEEWPRRLGQAHARALVVSPNPERRLARTFVRWRQLSGFERELLEVALPEATGDLPPKRLAEVGQRLRGGREEWELWLQAHPPRHAVSRAVRGVLRRGER